MTLIALVGCVDSIAGPDEDGGGGPADDPTPPTPGTLPWGGEPLDVTIPGPLTP